VSLLVAVLLWYLVLPSPWGALGIVAALFLEAGEIAWGLRLARRRALVGAATLVGRHGRVAVALAPRGQVVLDGERWSARSVGRTAAVGEDVVVRRVEGIELEVEPE
jgi:membrane protein implicated in regulation of membrane protease activity